MLADVSGVGSGVGSGEEEGGGITPDAAVLLMQSKLGSSLFKYSSSYWTNNSTLNPECTAATTPGVDAKLPAFNTLSLQGLRFCRAGNVASAQVCYEYHFHEKNHGNNELDTFLSCNPTALQLFSHPNFIPVTDIDQTAFETVFGKVGGNQDAAENCDMQRPGFNTKCADGNRARFGYCKNGADEKCRPLDFDDADVALGIGIQGEGNTSASAGVQGWPGQDAFGKAGGHY
jgi:hypothetical protein